MKTITLFAILTVAATASGCAKDSSKPSAPVSPWVKAAPTTTAETGILVENQSRAQIEKLLAEKGGRARAINEAHGLYEIFGLSRETIEAALPGAHAEANEMVQGFQTTQEFTTSCRPPANAAEAPHPVAMAVNHPELTPGHLPIIDLLSGPVLLSALSSTPAITVGGTLSYHWDVQGPTGSAATGKTGESFGFAITPDMPGDYHVLLVVRDQKGSCASTQLRFGVTYNVAYEGPALRRPLSEQARQAFKHLDVIGAPAAWSTTRGDGVTIAVLDSGVSYNHPDLSPNIAFNPNVMDSVGWDFVMGDNMPVDDNGHGSHVAGLAAGAMAGVAPNARILPVKVLNAMGSGDLGSIKAGIFYAVDRGANIIVMSLGGKDDGHAQAQLKASFDYAEQHGVLMVVAAGNEHNNNDAVAYYPASMPNSNVISVAATTLTGQLAQYSNFGQHSVAIAAPGGAGTAQEPGLWGPFYWHPENAGYIPESGTSMAAPLVAGAAALLKSVRHDLTPAQIKEILMTHGSQMPNLGAAVVSSSVLNIPTALRGALADNAVARN